MPKKQKSRLEEIENEVIDITRSYTRKLNMSAYGGKQYETADISATLTVRDVPMLKSAAKSAELFDRCVNQVEESINFIIGTLSEDEVAEEAPKKKKKAKKEVVEEDEEEDDEESDEISVGGFSISKSEFREISPFVNDITLSKTSGELAKAAKRIKSEAADLTDDQKKYLSAYYKKRLSEVEDEEDDE